MIINSQIKQIICIATIICILLVPSSKSSINFPIIKNKNVSSMIESDFINVYNFQRIRLFPIQINNNNGLTGLIGKLNGINQGSGTEQDPYIISNWEFNRYTFFCHRIELRHAILLQNINKHVIIEKNIINVGEKNFGFGHLNNGILIDNCENITIKNNVIFNSDVGIAVTRSSNCIIEYNEIYQNQIGIVYNGIAQLKTSIITYNNIHHNNDGIRCRDSNVQIIQNQIYNNYDGIFTSEDQSMIKNNNIIDNHETGIVCDNSNATIQTNEITNNNWGIFLKGGPTPFISKNNIADNNIVGIYISKGSPAIENNTISYNGVYGINHIDFHGKSLIYHNKIHGNRIGIDSQINDIIKYNIISSNIEYGIKTAGNPIIQYNNIQENDWGLERSGGTPWVTATYNWWGSKEGPGGYGPGSGDPITYQAFFNPWLIQPHPSAGPS